MLKMKGLDFSKEVRTDPKLNPTPIVVLTTSDEVKDRVEASQLDVAGYVLKPLTLTYLPIRLQPSVSLGPVRNALGLR